MSILPQNIQIGLDYLGINDPETIVSIIKANIENYFWNIEEIEKKERIEKYNNRFKVPIGKTKKELEQIKKETRNKITELDKQWLDGGRENIFLEIEIEDYQEKQKKIKAIINRGIDKNFNSDLLKAKAFPIENIIEFNKAGFAKCPFHQEKTSSAKLYKGRNKLHCFGCGKDADAIDVTMIINNCSISEAIKKLCLY